MVSATRNFQGHLFQPSNFTERVNGFIKVEQCVLKLQVGDAREHSEIKQNRVSLKLFFLFGVLVCAFRHLHAMAWE